MTDYELPDAEIDALIQPWHDETKAAEIAQRQPIYPRWLRVACWIGAGVLGFAVWWGIVTTGEFVWWAFHN